MQARLSCVDLPQSIVRVPDMRFGSLSGRFRIPSFDCLVYCPMLCAQGVSGLRPLEELAPVLDDARSQHSREGTHHVKDDEVVARLVDGDVQIDVRIRFVLLHASFVRGVDGIDAALELCPVDIVGPARREFGRHPFGRVAKLEIVVDDHAMGRHEFHEGICDRAADGGYDSTFRHRPDQAAILDDLDRQAKRWPRNTQSDRKFALGEKEVPGRERAFQNELFEMSSRSFDDAILLRAASIRLELFHVALEPSLGAVDWSGKMILPMAFGGGGDARIA